MKVFNKKNWLISVLRRASLRYPPANQALQRTKETYYIKSKKGKDLKRVKWTCEKCGKPNLKSSERERDHIIPLVDLSGFKDWNSYIDRYLIDASGYQILCIPCHEAKSLSEGVIRKAKRHAKKKKKSL